MVQKIHLVFDSAVTLHDLQKAYTLLALDHFGGNKTLAARSLGITIKTIYNRLHTYGIQNPVFGPWIVGQADARLVGRTGPDLHSQIMTNVGETEPMGVL